MASIAHTTTRRAVLGSIPALVATGCGPVLANSLGTDSRLEALWREFLDLRAALGANTRALYSAYDSLPWWANNGPVYVDHHGRHVGRTSGWPARQDVEPPTHEGAVRLLRESPHDIRSEYQHAVRIGFDRAAARRRARERGRALIARIRARDAERRRAGIEVLEALSDDLAARSLAIEEAIENLRPMTLDVIAARLVLGLMSMISVETTIARSMGEFRESTDILADMLPQLSGSVGATVAAIFEDEDRPIMGTIESMAA